MFTINAKARKEIGKGGSRRLRVRNKFPAIVYGGEEVPVPIELRQDHLNNIATKAEFYSAIVTLVIDGKETKVKIKAVQRHPFKPTLTHIDFVRV
ncbi:50S ribosomal protein L25 [Serratia symbiotica]|nr:50S ribosomal protein L25 [Serratia symbiotica]